MKTNPANEAQIKIYAKLLRIPTFSDYNELLHQMQPEENFEDLLLDLMRKEVSQRQGNQNKRRVKAAGFPYHKSLDDLEVDRYKEKITQNFISELSSCQFISERKNIILIGTPGRGKTHIAIGLGMKACSLGKRVCFKNVMSLSTELAEAKGNHELRKLEKKLQQADLLILDELGYVSFDRYQSELLFKVISDRSERGSIIVTTNLPFSKWASLFENNTLIAALIDRLTFKSYVLDMNGESYRLEKTLNI